MNSDYEHIDDSRLKALNRDGGFTCPEGYFEHSRNAILAHTLASESNPDQLDEAYFERTRFRILQKTTGTPEKALMTIWYRKPLIQFAAAAVFIVSISFGMWFNNPKPMSFSDVLAGASMSDEEILQYLQQNDLRDIPITEISFASTDNIKTTEEENYIINQTDEQTLLEEL